MKFTIQHPCRQHPTLLAGPTRQQLNVGLILALTILIAVPCAPTISATEEPLGQPIDILGQVGGSTYAVAVEGHYAYVGIGPRLAVVDISNPAQPTLVGQTGILPGFVNDVTVAGEYAFVAGDVAGLRVVHIADPARPVEVGSFDTNGVAYGVALSGSLAYVADFNDGLRILDVTDPTHPHRVGYFSQMGDMAMDVAVNGDYAYVAHRTNGELRVLDVSHPAAPRRVASRSAPGCAFGLTVAGDRAYVAYGSWNGVCGPADNAGMRVFDVTDPTRPEERGFYHAPQDAQDVTVVGNYAFVADSYGGLRAVDVTDAMALREVGSYEPWPLDASGVAVIAGLAYIAGSGGGLRIVDVRMPSNPQEMGVYDPAWIGWNVTTDGHYAYIAADKDGLAIVDIGDPERPITVGHVASPPYTHNVKVKDGYAYLASNWRGLAVMDVADPARPTEAANYFASTVVLDVALAGNHAYLAATDALKMIDIAVPTYPAEVNSVELPGTVMAVEVAGDYAYVAAGEAGLRIVYIADTILPLTEVSGYDTPGNAMDVAVRGNYAYIADHNEGLRVIDVGDPAHPIEVGSYKNTDWPVVDNITVSSGYAYLGQGNGGLRVVDIRDPAHPTLFSAVNLQAVTGTAVAEGFIYSANWSGGLYIMQFRDSGPLPDPSDAYEPDSDCTKASRIQAFDQRQHHNFHVEGDEDWAWFEAEAGKTYILEAAAVGERADLNLWLLDACGDEPILSDENTLGVTARLNWKAETAGRYYMKVFNQDQSACGDGTDYALLVREQPLQPAAIVVAGRDQHDSEGPKIVHAADFAYNALLASGVSGERIYYLGPDPVARDPYPHESPHPIAAATAANLKYAITNWAALWVDPDRPLYLYLVDHGDRDAFFINGNGDKVTAHDLDAWLHQLEHSTRGADGRQTEINVIIEACYSGSFITAPNTISDQGRVIITSTHDRGPAYSSDKGAVFSDAFWSAAGIGDDLCAAFRSGQSAVLLSLYDQEPWLEGNGNAISNDDSDCAVAAKRRLAPPTRLYRPVIDAITLPAPTVAVSGTIRAHVRADKRIADVWAVIFPPSFAPPPPGTTLADSGAEIVHLTDPDGAGEYAGTYNGFTEKGSYRIVVNAEDVTGIQAPPRGGAVQVGSRPVWLPLVLR